MNESRVASAIIAGLVILSLSIFALETEFTQSELLKILGKTIAWIFGIEYCLRIWVANLTENGRRKYIFSFAGIIDLLAFLPAILVAGGSASLTLRLLRIFRLMQILKIKAVTVGIARIGKALHQCKLELLVSAMISLGLIFFSAILMYFAEGDTQPEAFGSVPRALWWAMATLTTVGYGDVYPITTLGKLIASTLAIIGIGAIALPAGIIANAFMTVSRRGDG